MREDIRDDVLAKWRVERVVVVADRVRRVELVAVLAIDDSLGVGLEGCAVGQCELVDEPGHLELVTDLTTPPGLGVMVARQVDDLPVRCGGAAPQRGEEIRVHGS